MYSRVLRVASSQRFCVLGCGGVVAAVAAVRRVQQPHGDQTEFTTYNYRARTHTPATNNHPCMHYTGAHSVGATGAECGSVEVWSAVVIAAATTGANWRRCVAARVRGRLVFD